MKLSQKVPLTWVAAAARRAALLVSFSIPALAGSLEVTNHPATGGPGEFAAGEIRREAAAKGMLLGNDANATRIEDGPCGSTEKGFRR